MPIAVQTVETGVTRATVRLGLPTASESVTVGGGLESISLVQNDKTNRFRAQDPWLVEHRNDVYMAMIETAEIVAERYQIRRERQDEYALQSQSRHSRLLWNGMTSPSTSTSPQCFRVCFLVRAQPP